MRVGSSEPDVKPADPLEITSVPAATRTPRSRWIEEGLRALAAGGPDAVRVEPLAQALGVTKGGFYWHFGSRQALLDEMLDTWERESVDEVIERADAGGPDGREALQRLFALGLEGFDILTTDLAVRDWARRDEAVAERLRRVDNRRMDFMRSHFAVFCADEADVEVRSMLAFSIWIGNRFVAATHGERSRGEVIDLVLRRLLD